MHGKGTVDWSKKQQVELIKTGRIKGFEGQHMKSVSEYPQYAGCVDNIQFLSHEDHLAAHNYGRGKSGYRSPTNGYYDTKTKTMHSFGNNPPKSPKVIDLSEAKYKNYSITKDNSRSKELSVSKSKEHDKKGGRAI